jgi:hypothetical protein
MTRLALLCTALALSGCLMPVKLPTPAEVCALPDAQRLALIEATGTQAQDWATACALLG